MALCSWGSGKATGPIFTQHGEWSNCGLLSNAMDLIFLGNVKADMWMCVTVQSPGISTHWEHFLWATFWWVCEQKPSMQNNLVSELQLYMNTDLSRWYSGEWKHLETPQSLLMSVLPWLCLTPYHVAQFSCWFKTNLARTFSCPVLPLLTQLLGHTDPKSSKLVRLSRGPNIFPSTN